MGGGAAEEQLWEGVENGVAGAGEVIADAWNGAVPYANNWETVMNQFATCYEERFTKTSP